MTCTVQSIADFLQRFAPQRLAEEWDNVGLLVGDPLAEVRRVMTCLTVTPASGQEAVDRGADLIVTHHPLPFRPLKRLTTDSTPGRLLLRLIRSGVAVYSPHTAFDSAAAGINQLLAEGLGLEQIAPLVQRDDDLDIDGLGAGRQGTLADPLSLVELVGRLKSFLRIDRLQVVGDDERRIGRVAVACGSAGEFLDPARRARCEVLVTGETSFHTCLEAEAWGLAVVLAGHYASERFGVERLAEVLASEFMDLEIWPSQQESDPLRWA